MSSCQSLFLGSQITFISFGGRGWGLLYDTVHVLVAILTTWALLGGDSFFAISGCEELLSSPLRDAGLRGELSSLGEVVGLPLPNRELGILTLLGTSLFSLCDTSWKIE